MEEPLRLLVRSWITDRGCVYRRSSSLSESDAFELLDAARPLIDKAQESGTIEEITLLKGRAFVLAHRSPDPDHPSRTAPGFVLIEILDPEVFFRSAVQKTLEDASLPTELDPMRADWKVIDLGRQTTVLRAKQQPLGKKRLTTGKIISTSLIALVFVMTVICYFSIRTWRAASGIGGGVADSSRQTNKDEDPETDNWNEARSEIKELLASYPEKKSPPGDPSRRENDRELLASFAELFQRPDLSKKLSDSDLKQYENLDSASHPFKAFLNRLLEHIPPLPSGEAALSSSDCMSYLRNLSSQLKSQAPYPIDLGLDNLPTLRDNAKKNLDYLQFRKDTLRNMSESNSIELDLKDWNRDDPWNKSSDKNAGYRWVPQIRELIKKNYHRQ